MINKEIKKESFTDIFRRNKANFSISLGTGFATIEFDDVGEMVVKFLNDEGYINEDLEISYGDLQKVSKFVEDLKLLKLENYNK